MSPSVLITELIGGVCVARIRGDLDMAAADGLVKAIVRAAQEAQATAVVLDLTSCDYLDSTGVSAIFLAHEQLTSRQLPLTLVSPASSPVCRLLKIVQLEEVVATYETVDLALERPGP
jgi:anti-sigma B factor antagonist